MDKIILFREFNKETKEEIKIAEKYFPVSTSRVFLNNKIVIARYSALPFYRELENDLKIQGSQLVNSYKEHSYISNFEYYQDISNYTPETCFDIQTLPDNWDGYVIKGRTNSRKDKWNQLMYAKTKKEATIKSFDLLSDSLIQEQGVIFRKYEKLKVFEYGVNGIPFSNEWRLFFFKENLLSFGYYWVQAEKILDNSLLPKEAIDFANKIAKKISKKTNFFVLDIAEKIDGSWIVIEVNDGQQSGLSNNDPDILYKNLSLFLK